VGRRNRLAVSLDALSRAVSRRSLVLASLAAATPLTSRAARPAAEACGPNGTRCGGAGQPKCSRCCSRYTERQGNGQRRCTLRRDFQRCRRDDQCASAVCLPVPCEGLDKPICIPGFLVGEGEDLCAEGAPSVREAKKASRAKDRS
jgi:hypothetical protein